MEEKRLKDELISKVEKSRNSKRGRKPNCPKTGGRQLGTPNKKTILMKDLLDDLSHPIVSIVFNALKAVPPQDQLKFILELLPYLAPKLNPKDVQEPAEDKQPTDILNIVGVKQ